MSLNLGTALGLSLARRGVAGVNGGGTAPAAPSLLIVSSVSSTQIDAMWIDNSDDETEFDLQYDTVDTFTSPTTVNPAADATSHEVTGLTKETTYYFRVRATNANGDSDWSNTAQATTYADAPVAGSHIWAKADAGTFQDVAGSTVADGDGEVVGLWEDQSGNNNDFTAVTDGSNRPTLQTNEINGLPVIRADGSDDYLRTSGNITLTNFTMSCVVLPREEGVNTDILLYHYDGSDGWYFRAYPATPLRHVNTSVDVPGQLALDVPSIVTVQRGSGSIVLRINGVEVATSAITVPTTVDEIFMFASNALGAFAPADMGEFLLYDSELSSANIDTVEGYLADRWAVALETADDKIAWLKSDTEVYEEVAASTLAADDGDTVGYWKDQSGKGSDFTAGGDDTTRPTLQTNEVNGHPVIRADGVNDYLKTVLNVWLKEFTLTMVLRTYEYDSDTRVIFHYDGTDGWWVRSISEDGFTHVAPNDSLSPSLDVSPPMILTIERTGTDVTIYHNGQQADTKTVGTVAMTIDEIFLFVDRDLLRDTQVDLAELILRREVDSTTRQHYEAYLAQRYAIDLPASALSWTQLADMPGVAHQHGFAELDGVLYAVGGTDGAGTELDTVFAFDVAAGTWSTKTSLPATLQSGVLRAANGKLYFIGGRNEAGTHVNTVYEYDPSGDSWATKTAMPTGREDMGAAVISDKIYVFGGINTSSTAISTLEVYDPAADSWDETKADMPAPKILGDFGATYNGKAYALGGADSFANYPTMPMDGTVYEYDPGTDSWDSSLAEGPAPKSYKEVAVIGSKLYVIGGETVTAGKPTKSVWSYDVDTDTWAFEGLTPNGTLLSAAGAVAYDGSIYISGGNHGGAAVNELWRLDP